VKTFGERPMQRRARRNNNRTNAQGRAVCSGAGPVVATIANSGDMLADRAKLMGARRRPRHPATMMAEVRIAVL